MLSRSLFKTKQTNEAEIMQIHMMVVIRSVAALIAGGVIGLGFGLVQHMALRRNEKLEQNGKLHSGWSVMPGSMKRVAYLLVALVVVQIICPLLFMDGSQWWVSGGVVVGYGVLLFRQLQQARKH
jgi:hypothetical protein